MAEPTSSASASATVATLALAGVYPGLPVNVILGSFAGAVLFVATSNDFGWMKKLCLFLASFVAGFLGAETTAELMEVLLHVSSIDPGVGALVAGAITVRLLLFVFGQLEKPTLPFFNDRHRGPP